MDKERIEEIKEKYSVFKKRQFPKSPDKSNEEYASQFADLVLYDSNIAGILSSIFGQVKLDEGQKKIYKESKLAIENFISSSNNDDEISDYFKSLLGILEDIDI